MRLFGVPIVDDWKKGLKWFSTNMWLLEIALQSTWMTLDADERAALPHNLVTGLSLTVAVLGIAGRFIKQKTDPGPPGDDHHVP